MSHYYARVNMGLIITTSTVALKAIRICSVLLQSTKIQFKEHRLDTLALAPHLRQITYIYIHRLVSHLQEINVQFDSV